MKDAYWFKHDSNAKDDPKCVLLIEQLGLEGFGIYWVLIEILREQPNYHYPLALIPSIARRYNTSTQKVEAVIKGYGLFSTNDEEFFFSESLINRMKPMEEQREQARLAGKASAEKRRKQALLSDSSTTVQRSFNDRSTIREEKRREDKSIYSQQVADKWNEIVKSLPKVVKVTENRKRAIKAKDADLSEFEKVFRKVEESDFLTGRVGDWNSCGFDWVMKPANWVKILEGNYDNRVKKSGGLREL